MCQKKQQSKVESRQSIMSVREKVVDRKAGLARNLTRQQRRSPPEQRTAHGQPAESCHTRDETRNKCNKLAVVTCAD